MVRLKRICKLDLFKRNLYAEFESNCFKLLSVPSSRVREVFADRDNDINAKFEAAWEFGGAPVMRQEMSMTIAILELVYHETEIERQLTDEERVEGYASWDIGLDAETVEEYYLKQQQWYLEIESDEQPINQAIRVKI